MSRRACNDSPGCLCEKSCFLPLHPSFYLFLRLWQLSEVTALKGFGADVCEPWSPILPWNLCTGGSVCLDMQIQVELVVQKVVCCNVFGPVLPCLTLPFLLAGLDAELSYVRNDVVNHYALSFNLLIPSETNNLHFTWHAKSKVSRQDFCSGYLRHDLFCLVNTHCCHLMAFSLQKLACARCKILNLYDCRQ